MLRERRDHLSEEASGVTADLYSPTAREIAKQAHKTILGLRISGEEEVVLQRLRQRIEERRETVAYEQMKREGEQKEIQFRELMARLTNRMSDLQNELTDKNVLVLEHAQKIEENKAALLESAAKLMTLEQRKEDLESAVSLGGVQNEATLLELNTIRTSLEKEQKARTSLQEITQALTNALTHAKEENGADIRRLTKELTKIRSDKLRLQAQLETEQTIAQMLADGVRDATGGELDDLPDATF